MAMPPFMGFVELGGNAAFRKSGSRPNLAAPTQFSRVGRTRPQTISSAVEQLDQRNFRSVVAPLSLRLK
jgi:hypothetical protein